MDCRRKYHRLVSHFCLRNLKGNDDLVGSSNGQDKGAVVTLDSLCRLFVGQRLFLIELN